MPIFEYHCDSCNCHFEKLVLTKSDQKIDCPKCSGKTKRLISGGAGFVFKGSGFYITDNRSSSYKADAAKDKAPSTPATPEKKTPPSPPKA